MNAPEASPRALGYRFPAEWEPHRATWLAWPHNESDFPSKLSSVRWVFCELIRGLCRAERVQLLVPSESERSRALDCIERSGADVARVEVSVQATNRSWTRDYLPTWLVPMAPVSRAGLGAVKWRFNGWARYPDHDLDEAAGRAVARSRSEACWLARQGSQVDAAPLVLEGGAIDVDGEGTLLTTLDCLLGRDHPRNPGLDAAAIERRLSEYLSVDEVIWLPAAVAGDDTSGHVDDVARFVAPGKVVVATESNARDENYAALCQTRERLQGRVDARGRRLDVIPLPMPEPVVFQGERLPASYANFYVANDHVFVPTFNDVADRQALGILQELFPSRRVVGIHSRDLILGLGSLHCSTQQEPWCCADP